MKKIVLAVFMAAMALSLSAQINFREGGFAEALEAAKSENKLVFMDCYTSWCGPCKLMASKEFVKNNVSASSAVSAVRTAIRNIQFSSERNMTVSAFTGLYKYFCSICKHYTAPPVGVECEGRVTMPSCRLSECRRIDRLCGEWCEGRRISGYAQTLCRW